MDSSIVQELRKYNSSPMDLIGYLYLDIGKEIIWLFNIIFNTHATVSTTQR